MGDGDKQPITLYVDKDLTKGSRPKTVLLPHVQSVDIHENPTTYNFRLELQEGPNSLAIFTISNNSETTSESEQSNKNDAGCFIATTAYGSSL
jgi:hypothetical protein